MRETIWALETANLFLRDMKDLDKKHQLQTNLFLAKIWIAEAKRRLEK